MKRLGFMYEVSLVAIAGVFLFILDCSQKAGEEKRLEKIVSMARDRARSIKRKEI